MNTVVSFKRPPKSARTQMETMIITADLIKSWRKPTFQRPVKINEKVRAMSEVIRAEGGIIPGGVFVLGVIERGAEAGTYLVDGQHRCEAFLISGVPEGLADVRIIHFETLAEMGEMYVQLQEQLVRMRPDDSLRAMEQTIPALAYIKRKCDFVGYDQLRRGTASPILSMGLALRAWAGSAAETPVMAPHALSLARAITDESARQLVDFLEICREAWGRDVEYQRLWSSLNLTICMWLYRRLVLDKDRGVKRFAVLTRDQFKRAMMSVSADPAYLDWLVARHMGERDRSPCYGRLRAIIVKRLAADTGGKAKMPAPPWYTKTGT
jgi:hypothetical protein